MTPFQRPLVSGQTGKLRFTCDRFELCTPVAYGNTKKRELRHVCATAEILVRVGDAVPYAMEAVAEHSPRNMEPAAPPPAPPNIRNLLTVAFAIALFYAGAASTFGPGALLARELVCEKLGIAEADCATSDAAEAETAQFLSGGSGVSGVVKLLATPVYAMMSDRYGRRPVLLIPIVIDLVVGAVSQVALLPSVSSFWTDTVGIARIWPNVAITVLGSLSGGFYPYVGVVFAVAADETRALSASKRAAVFGSISSSIYLGLMVGPVAGGVIAGVTVDRYGSLRGNVLSLLFSVGVSFVRLCVVLLFFSESLESERRSAWSWKHANPFSSIAILRHSKVTKLFAICIFCELVSSDGCTAMASLYWQSTFAWTSQTIGFGLGLQYAANFFGLAVLLPLLQPALGTKNVLVLSTCASTCYYVAFGLVGCTPFESCVIEEGTTGWPVWIVLASGVLNVLFFPGIRATTAIVVGPRNYGKAMVSCSARCSSLCCSCFTDTRPSLSGSHRGGADIHLCDRAAVVLLVAGAHLQRLHIFVLPDFSAWRHLLSRRRLLHALVPLVPSTTDSTTPRDRRRRRANRARKAELRRHQGGAGEPQRT